MANATNTQVGRSVGHEWAVSVATSGQFCWPPTGSSYWPLTGVLREAHRFLLEGIAQTSNLVAATLEHSDWSDSWIRSAAATIDIVFVAHETYGAHEETLLDLQEQHHLTLVITEGAAGSRLVGPSGSASAAASLVEGAIEDTTGAGDAFASAFCAAWLLGDSNAVALRLANWYAASKIRRRGPRAFPSQRDFHVERDRLLKKMKSTENSGTELEKGSHSS